MAWVYWLLVLAAFDKNPTPRLNSSSSMADTFKDALPTDLVKHITAICGKRGEEWFDRLPYLIAELEKKWACKVIEPFPGIEFNFVARAATGSGEEVVIKIAPP